MATTQQTPFLLLVDDESHLIYARDIAEVFDAARGLLRCCRDVKAVSVRPVPAGAWDSFVGSIMTPHYPPPVRRPSPAKN